MPHMPLRHKDWATAFILLSRSSPRPDAPDCAVRDGATGPLPEVSHLREDRQVSLDRWAGELLDRRDSTRSAPTGATGA